MRAAQPDRYMDLRRRASGGRCRGRVGGQVWRAVLMGGCKRVRGWPGRGSRRWVGVQGKVGKYKIGG